MNTPTPPADARPSSIPSTLRPGRVLAAALLAVALGDWLLRSGGDWTAGPPGIGFGLFFTAVAALILWVRPRENRGSVPGWFAPLFAGPLAASAIGFCFTNFCALLLLLLGLSGRTFFAGPGLFWQQILAQAAAYAGAPMRPLIVLNDFAHDLLASEHDPARPRLRRHLLGLVSVVVPAAALALLFALFLGLGNAVLGWFFSRFFGSLWEWLVGFDLSFGRLFFWFFVGLAVLPLFSPARRRGSCYFGWAWTTRLHRFPDPATPAAARTGDLRVLAILGTLNLLFLAANGIDACYLWARQAVPPGANAAQFVHEGTGNLIATTLLSGIVLTLLFNRAPARTAGRAQRWLAYGWIAQNLFLLSSVVLRLKLYTDAYALTSTRLSLLAFLLLDAAGFVLLTMKIVREKSAAWLLGGCATAVFVLFYAVQFLDFGGIAARYNVARWKAHPQESAPLDVGYLGSVGPGGWGPLREVAEDTEDLRLAAAAREKLASIRWARASRPSDWRTWQARQAWNRHFLELETPIRTDPTVIPDQP